MEIATVSVQQAGLRLHLSQNQIIRKIMVGELPGWQDATGGRWRVSAEAVERLAEQQRSSAPVPAA